MAYLLDADTFITAKRDHYQFDFCPAYWDWLIRSHSNGVVFSIEKVYDELIGTGDDLSEWVSELEKSFFLPHVLATNESWNAVSSWIRSQEQYEEPAIGRFQKGADFYLVVQALAGKHTIVTHERSAPDAKKSVKIPDVCKRFKIKCVSPFVMLKAEKARFVLAPRK